MIMNPTLPEGWESEDRGDVTILIRPGVGYVTIDWERRSCGLGMLHRGPIPPLGMRYGGRGWKERLLEAAINKLRAV